jgi:hypothetical protein
MQTVAEWTDSVQHAMEMHYRLLLVTGIFSRPNTRCSAFLTWSTSRGRIDFTTEGDASIGGGRGGNNHSNGEGGRAASWIPSLADEARDYIESIHAHSRYCTCRHVALSLYIPM